MRNRNLAWLLLPAMVLAACGDSPLDTNPTAQIDSETALSTARGIELGLNGAYRGLQSGNTYGNVHMVYPDLYADNLDFTGTFQTDREVAQRNISTSNGQILGTWGSSYNAINRANNLLDAIPRVTELTAAQASRYRGEALFIRALVYFDLVRHFGGVPLVLEPSRGVGESALVSRASQQETYARVVQDLEEAVPLLPTGRVPGRATRDAANALLARVYLETGNNAQARDKATAVINSGNYSLVSNYRSIFTTKNSQEAIFELQFSINNTNSLAFWYYPASLGGRLGFAPTAELYNYYEAGDARRDASIGIAGTQRHGIKYNRIATSDDNVRILRLAEMYLIRAEANARLGADPAAVRADLNVVRARAGLAALPTTLTSQQDLLAAILRERRVEFAFEGHRFFDLRRFGIATQVLSIPAERLLWPIPQADIDVNENLTQNPGY
jgi:starch-binding outer membrane protein, SusD/RagB family